jgi:sodium transport system permease protein
MKFVNVWIIFRKEFLDILRDRRTIVSMILLPVLFIPLLTVGIGGLFSSQMDKMKERNSPVVMLGSKWAPELLASLQKTPGLQIIPEVPDTATVLAMLHDQTIRAAVIVPEKFEEIIQAPIRMVDSLKIRLLYDDASVESGLVMGKVRDALNEYQKVIVEHELQRRQLHRSVIEPFQVVKENRASPQKMAGAALGMFLPYLIILMIMASSQYPAIDLTAGEKERGTMETLLVSPASRLEIVLGKFLTTMLAGLISGCLSMASMLVSMTTGVSMFGNGGGGEMMFQMNPLALGLVALLILPVAALFASALIAIAVNARSYKEAQSYVYPLMLLIIVPALTSMVPGLEIDARMAFIPVVNVSLIIRNAFMGQYDPLLIALTFMSSLIYAAFAIFVAVRVFQKESVLLKT